MSIVTIDGRRLTLDEVEAVARRGVRVELDGDPRVVAGIERSAQFKDELIEQGVPIYGVTTGVGDSVDTQIAHGRAAALQRNTMRKLGCGTGDLLPQDGARAVMLLRANTLARGQSAVRPVVVETLLACLNAGIAPCIPEEGSVGASGDLVPLSYVLSALCGERKVTWRGAIVPAARALSEAGIAPLQLRAKEGLAVLNGTAYMTGVLALVAKGARRLALLADACTALATEALTSTSGPFHAFLHDDAKPHPGQIRSASNIRALLSGSRLAQPYRAVLEQAGSLVGGGMRKLPVRLQERYSVRCAPHFVGVLYDALEWIERWLSVEMNSASDNPLFDADAREVHSGGNFSGGHVALAADALKTALASVADLLDRQLAVIVDEKTSRGLPANLSPDLPADHPEAGTHHGFKGVQIAVSSLTAEALGRCMPMTAFSRSTESHNQDKVSMGATAARGARDVLDLTEKVGVLHLLALCQAADLRGAEGLGSTRRIYEVVRSLSAPVAHDRELDEDLGRVLASLREGELARTLDDLAAPAHSKETAESF
jgi:histidine ammonia-lyase/phenylalanine ammonia-lyase